MQAKTRLELSTKLAVVHSASHASKWQKKEEEEEEEEEKEEEEGIGDETGWPREDTRGRVAVEMRLQLRDKTMQVQLS